MCGISTLERGIDWNFHVTPGIQRGSGEEENTVRVEEKMHLTQGGQRGLKRALWASVDQENQYRMGSVLLVF